MRILFTSASKPAALALARVLDEDGHRIYATDTEPAWGTAPARYSRAYIRFYQLRSPPDLLHLWHSIGNKFDRIFPFEQLPIHILGRLEEMGAAFIGELPFNNNADFLSFVRDNVIHGVNMRPNVVKVPASFTIHSQEEVAEILAQYPDTKFSLQPDTYSELHDSDTLVGSESPTSAPPFFEVGYDAESQSLAISCASLSDSMVESIKKLLIPQGNPYRISEVFDDGVAYSAYALVQAGDVRTFFVTCKGAIYHLAHSQPLFEILYQFTQQFVEQLGTIQERNGSQRLKCQHRTMYLTLQFLIRDVRGNGEIARKITAISCESEPHVSLVLLCSAPSARRKLAQAYSLISQRLIEPRRPDLPPSSIACGVYSAPATAKTLVAMITPVTPLRGDWWAGLLRVWILSCVSLVYFREERWDCRNPGPSLCYRFGPLVKDFSNSPGFT